MYLSRCIEIGKYDCAANPSQPLYCLENRNPDFYIGVSYLLLVNILQDNLNNRNRNPDMKKKCYSHVFFSYKKCTK